jgi:hypothetical protein
MLMEEVKWCMVEMMARGEVQRVCRRGGLCCGVLSLKASTISTIIRGWQLHNQSPSQSCTFQITEPR